MEPKFQSSFIPKGPVASSGRPTPVQAKQKSLVGFLATVIFALALAASAGVFGYNQFLSYRISQTGAEIEAARAQVDADGVRELVDLDNRLASTANLLNSHAIISPLFDFLESSTLRSVRFTEFGYSTTDKGIELRMSGEALGYSALALQSEAFSASQYFKNPVFSDLNLDEDGNVTFTFKATVDPTLVSYKRIIEQEAILEEAEVQATSTPLEPQTEPQGAAPAEDELGQELEDIGTQL